MGADPAIRWWLERSSAEPDAPILLQAQERGCFHRGYVYRVSMPLDRTLATLRRVLRATLVEAKQRVAAIKRPAPFPGRTYDPKEA